jgi:putative thioredoxin
VLSAHARGPRLDPIGDTESAVRLAAQAALENPDDTRIPQELTKMLILQERYGEADDLLQALPPEAHATPELRRLAAHVKFLRTAREAPPKEELLRAVAADPDNFTARFQLGAAHLVADEF